MGRVLCNVKTKLKSTFEYEWVPSHQDRYKLWSQLPLVQQLNCICDSLAKTAVQESLHCFDHRTRKQVLPCESAAVFVGGSKQTSDVARDVRFALGYSDAEAFYTTPLGPTDSNGNRHKNSGLGWSREAFRAVDWEALDATLHKKTQMYKQWLAKQCSGFCGTQTMVARWDSKRDGKCPDCGCRENAAHLNLCRDEGRDKLFNDMTTELQNWLYDNYAHPEIAYWLPQYIRDRGINKLSSYPHLSSEMKQVAMEQDLIPW